jgi:hypothetical protein
VPTVVRTSESHEDLDEHIEIAEGHLGHAPNLGVDLFVRLPRSVLEEPHQSHLKVAVALARVWRLEETEQIADREKSVRRSCEFANLLAEVLGQLVELADEVMSRDVVGDAAVMHVRALPCEVGHMDLKVVAEVHEQVDPMRAAAMRGRFSGHHRAALVLADRIRASPTDKRRQELNHSEMIQPQVKRKEGLQILDEDRAWDVRLIGKQTQRVICKQIDLSHA